MQVGVISDTHGLVRAEALSVLRNSELVLHAGDVGKPEVLTRLAAIARVVAVRGNVDRGAWADALPAESVVEIAGHRVCLIHNINDLTGDPERAAYSVVVSGHSHKPAATRANGILYLNPGSAGPRRFRLPVAVAKLFIGRSRVRAQIIEFPIG